MKIFIAVSLFLNVAICQAQTEPTQSFFIKEGKSPFGGTIEKVGVIDSADYIREVSFVKYKENLYEVTDYYPNNFIKKTGGSNTRSFCRHTMA